jgi:hypothetical protein
LADWEGGGTGREAMNNLEPLLKGLTYLQCCLTYSDRDRHITVLLPKGTWMALMYETGKERVAASEARGHGGIVVDYRPPEGESYDTGFWCNGAWIKHV